MLVSKSSLGQKVWCCGLLLVVGLVACGKKDKDSDDDEDEAAAPASVASTGAGPVAAPLALVSTPVEAMDRLGGALDSAMSVGGDSLTGTAGASLALTADDHVSCSETGLPISKDAARNVGQDGKSGEAALPDSDADFAGGRFFCMIAADTGDSGSIQGAIGEAKMIACLVGDDIVFDGVERAFDITVANNPCFGGGVPDGITAATIKVKSTANDPAITGGAGWGFDAHLSLNIGDESIGIDLLGLFTDKHVALTVRGGGTATDAYSFVLDKAAGSVRYEGRFQRFEANGWADHTRLLLTGTLDDELRFIDLASIEGATSAIYGASGGSGSNNGSTDVLSGVLMTAKGTKDAGFRTFSYKCAGQGDACSADDLAIWVPVVGTGACYGGACGGNDGLQLKVASDLGFLMRPKSYESVVDWYETMTPLGFAGVTLEESQK